MLSILTEVYRLWSSLMSDYCLDHQEHWLPDGVYGYRRGRDAVAGALATSLDMAAGGYSGGPSTEVEKAFDLIARKLLWRVMWRRGIYKRRIRGLRAMYRQLRRCYSHNGGLSWRFLSFGGILQGCAAIAVALNTMTTS